MNTNVSWDNCRIAWDSVTCPMITKDNASELSAMANKVRWEKWRKDRENMGAVEQLIEAVKANQVVAATPIEKPIEPLGVQLMRVQEELVARMMGEKDARKVGTMARALRDVRETYHLVTGQAKPGTQGIVKPDRRSRQPQVQSAPEPDDTPQQVVPP